ncbi:MAG: hypothetical protein ACWA5P_01470 [bacterium]
MSDKKHIDRLFQEKFKDFEVSPDPAVWDAISQKLDQKDDKRRRIIPFWLKLGGIAAGLALLFIVGRGLFNNSDSNSSNQPQLVEEEVPVLPSNNNNNQLELNNLNDIIEDDNLSESEQPEINLETPNEQESVLKDNVEVVQSGGNERSNNENKSLSNTNRKNIINSTSQKDAAIVNNDKIPNVPLDKKQLFNEKEDNLLKDKVNNNLNNAVVGNNTQSDEQNAENLGIENTTIDQTKSVINSSEEAITNATTEETDKAEELENSIEKAIAEQQQLEEENLVEDEEANRKRWSVAPNVAPVYFNTLGSGSSIDGQFNSNSKSGNIDMSYGVAVNYELNKRLKVRAGVNQLNIGYNTNNVIVYNNPEPLLETPTLKNVKMNNEGQMLSFLSGDDLNFAQVPGVVSQNISSSIDQELGFIEVPVELAYTLSNKKFGVDLIGGVSTLILNRNEIYGSLQGERTLLGEATNINKTSFSANLGVGLNYTVSEKVNLKLEPTFKYQLNTFTDTSGNFQPFVFGVYTGFSFKF